MNRSIAEGKKRYSDSCDPPHSLDVLRCEHLRFFGDAACHATLPWVAVEPIDSLTQTLRLSKPTVRITHSGCGFYDLGL